jgi:U4/U6.U5 tri-snRNP-associated protein 1
LVAQAPSTQSFASKGVVMGYREASEEIGAGGITVKEEDDEDEDEGAILNAIQDAGRAMEGEESGAVKDEALPEFGAAAQQTFSTGMPSTLNILQQQCILAPPATKDQIEREKTQLQRDKWLADQRRRVAQRELEKLNARGGNKDQATREYENRLRAREEARQNLGMFKNYKPDVNIVDYDEFGRALTWKEAWKVKSHGFHGKGPGKMKVEKRSQKIEEEKKTEYGQRGYATQHEHSVPNSTGEGRPSALFVICG